MSNNNKVCRACLTTKESFTYYFFENVESELFSFCTAIEINKEDSFPKSVCTLCYELLLKFSEFKHTCIQSQNLLLNYNENRDFKNEPLEGETPEEIVNVEVKVECCDNDNENSLDLDNDLAISDVNSKTSTKSLRKLTSNAKRKFLTRRPFLYTCEVCNKKFRLLERFETHKLEHEGKTVSIQCEPCNKTFMTWSGLKKHKDAEHAAGWEGIRCTICDKLYKNPATLKTHMYCHTEKKLHMCDICGKEVRSNVLKAHLETHNKYRSREFACEHCGKKFYTNSTLGTHVARRHAGRRFICHVCSYPFTDKYSLAKHLLIHQGVKPFKCEICHKSYTTHNSLVEHKRIHSGEKPFNCNFCKKGFISKKRLRDHLRTHTGERPHKCNACLLTFTQRGTLKRHMRVVHDKTAILTDQ